MRHDNDRNASRWGQNSKAQGKERKQQGGQQSQSGADWGQGGSEQSRGSATRDYRNFGSDVNDDFQKSGEMPFGPEAYGGGRGDRSYNQGYGPRQSPEFGSRRNHWGSGSEDVSYRSGMENNRFPGQFSDPQESGRNRSGGWEERTMTGSVPRDDAYYSGQATGGYGQNQTFGSTRSSGEWGGHEGLESEQYRTNSRGMNASSRHGSSSTGNERSGSSSERGKHFGKGPKGYSRSDERIKEELCECLSDAGEIDASNIDIRVEKGEVTLSGTVETRQEKRLAEDLIETISGVREINNQIKVSAKSSTSPDYKTSLENTREIGSTQKNKVA